MNYDLILSSGHSKYDPGAIGYIRERDEAVKVVDRVIEIFNSKGGKGLAFHDNHSKDVNTNLNTIVSTHNKYTRKYDGSIHFNASSGTTNNGIGTEVFHYDNRNVNDAKLMSKAIANAGGYKDRGAKTNPLYFTNKTNALALLIEVCFVNSKYDTDSYKKNFERICQAIADVYLKLCNVKVKHSPSTPTDKNLYRIQSGVYNTESDINKAITKLGTHNIANPKYVQKHKTSDGRYFFITGTYTGKNNASDAADKMKSYSILWNYTIITDK